MLEWIQKRAAEARKEETQKKWLANKGRLIESHAPEFFDEVTTLMRSAIDDFNVEFPEVGRRIDRFEPGVNRFTVERKGGMAVTLECRLDFAGHFVRYRFVRMHPWRNKTYDYDGTLEFDISGKNEVLLKTVEQVPMSVQAVTQFLLEPFFEF